MTLFQRRNLVGALSALAATALLLTGCSSEGSGEAGDAAHTTTEANEEIRAMLPENILESNVITIGTEAYYPPYEYFDEDDTTIVGLDPDLLAAISGVLGVEVNLENMTFDGLLPALDSGRIDMVTAAVSINADRLEKYDMVSYFSTPQGIMVLADNPQGIKSQADLCGLNLSVLEASHQEALLQTMNEETCASDPANVMAFSTDSDALQQLQTGRADALLTQFPVANYNAATFGGGETFAAIADESFGSAKLGHVFTKEQQELRDAMQAAINELIANGTYEEILNTHGLEVGAVETSEVNPL